MDTKSAFVWAIHPCKKHSFKFYIQNSHYFIFKVLKNNIIYSTISHVQGQTIYDGQTKFYFTNGLTIRQTKEWSDQLRNGGMRKEG